MIRGAHPQLQSILERLEAHANPKVKGQAIERLRNLQATRLDSPNETRSVERTDRADDATRVDFSDLRGRVKGTKRAEMAERLAKLKRIKAARENDEADGSIFEPGKEIQGEYRNGKFKTEDGATGSYWGMKGGQIGFEVDGYLGVLTPGHDAIAFNPSSGEAYTMKVRYGKGEFKISDIKEFAPEKWEPAEGQKPMIVEGQNPNVKFRYSNNGLFHVKVTNPKTGDLNSGKGFLDPNGEFFVAFDGGGSMTGHYDFSEYGKLEIYDRQQFDV